MATCVNCHAINLAVLGVELVACLSLTLSQLTPPFYIEAQLDFYHSNSLLSPA